MQEACLDIKDVGGLSVWPDEKSRPPCGRRRKTSCMRPPPSRRRGRDGGTCLYPEEAGLLPDQSGRDEAAVRLVGAVGDLDAQRLHLVGAHVRRILRGAAGLGQQQSVLGDAHRIAQIPVGPASALVQARTSPRFFQSPGGVDPATDLYWSEFPYFFSNQGQRPYASQLLDADAARVRHGAHTRYCPDGFSNMLWSTTRRVMRQRTCRVRRCSSSLRGRGPSGPWPTMQSLPPGG